MIINDNENFTQGVLLGGDTAYFNHSKAITINNYGEVFRIRLYHNDGGNWINDNEIQAQLLHEERKRDIKKHSFIFFVSVITILNLIWSLI